MRHLSLAVLVSTIPFGCGPAQQNSLTPVAPVQYDPEAMTGAAFTQLDKNGDGTIDGAEFAACPPLKKLKGGKGVTKADLKARFDAYAAGGPNSVVPIGITVERDRIGLVGATVTLTPEPFMGEAFKPVTGVTKENGYAEFRVEGAAGYGVPAGIYKLTVSKKDAAGAESVPARFNARSQEVREIYSDGRGGAVPLKIDVGSGQ